MATALALLRSLPHDSAQVSVAFASVCLAATLLTLGTLCHALLWVLRHGLRWEGPRRRAVAIVAGALLLQTTNLGLWMANMIVTWTSTCSWFDRSGEEHRRRRCLPAEPQSGARACMQRSALCKQGRAGMRSTGAALWRGTRRTVGPHSRAARCWALPAPCALPSALTLTSPHTHLAQPPPRPCPPSRTAVDIMACVQWTIWNCLFYLNIVQVLVFGVLVFALCIHSRAACAWAPACGLPAAQAALPVAAASRVSRIASHAAPTSAVHAFSGALAASSWLAQPPSV